MTSVVSASLPFRPLLACNVFREKPGLENASNRRLPKEGSEACFQIQNMLARK